MAKKAQINSEKCKGCDLCLAICPMSAIRKSGKGNKKGFDYVEIDLVKCTGCGACYVICPDCCIDIIEK
jgi:2-oxoglutarate ferredoxin oxidoreductase subunit delta